MKTGKEQPSTAVYLFGIALAMILILVFVCGTVKCEETTLIHFNVGCPLKYKKAVRAALLRKGIVFREVRASYFDSGMIHFSWAEWANAYTWNAPQMPETEGEWSVGNSLIIWMIRATDGTPHICATNSMWKRLTAEMLDYEIRLATEK